MSSLQVQDLSIKEAAHCLRVTPVRIADLILDGTLDMRLRHIQKANSSTVSPAIMVTYQSMRQLLLSEHYGALALSTRGYEAMDTGSAGTPRAAASDSVVQPKSLFGRLEKAK